ncbi:MAG: hypothetical protein LBS53_06005 [Synergistaceae bacterium]|jgi:hypothetical protein|nr:hypothetical protein [Synergistaceae bacterium]
MAMTFRRLCFFSLLLLCAAVALPSKILAGVRQEGETYIVDDATGYAPVIDGRKNEAREEAKREAYRDALEKALGVVVTGITEMENYAVVRDKVFSQTTGLVKSMDVAREWEEDGTFYLEAICKVSVSALDGVLGPAVLDAIGHPRIMALIDERIGDNIPFISTTEAEALRIFEHAGYLIVDPDQTRALLNVNAADAYNDPSIIMDAARTMRADVVILGRAMSAPFHTGKIEGLTMYGMSGTVQLKAVLTKTAYQITSQTVEASTGQEPALRIEDGAARCFREAASKASSAVVHKIAYALVSGATGIPGGTVNIKVADISFGDVESIEETLKEFIGKSGSVYEREYLNGNLEIDVVSEKTARNLASFMADKGVNINGVTAQTITASMLPAVADVPKIPQIEQSGFVSVQISGVASFRDADAIVNLIKEFIGEAGTMSDEFMGNALVVKIVSEKTARDIASYLSKNGINIDGVTPAVVSGKPKSAGL